MPKFPLPDDRDAKAHHARIGTGDERVSIHLIAGMDAKGNPREVFIYCDPPGDDLGACMDVISLLMSMLLQEGVPLERLTNKLMYMHFMPSGKTTNNAIPVAQSVVDYTARWLALTFPQRK